MAKSRREGILPFDHKVESAGRNRKRRSRIFARALDAHAVDGDMGGLPLARVDRDAVVGGRRARVRHRDGQRRLAENREDAALIGEIDALLAAEHIEGAAVRVSGPREDEGTARRKDEEDPRPANRRRGPTQPGPFRRLRSPHTRRLFPDPSPSCTIGSPFYHGPKAIR